MPELRRDTYFEVTGLMLMQIGRNEYHIEQLPEGDAQDKLIKQNKDLRNAVEMMQVDYYGEWILERNEKNEVAA
jgi:hypothetical protein